MIKIYLYLHGVYWLVLAGICAWAATRGLRGKSPLPSTLTLVVPVALLSTLIAVVSVHVGYVAPLAIVQDIVAAREALAHRPLPTTEIGPLVQKVFAQEPQPTSLRALWPELGHEEEEEFANVPQLMSLQAHPPFMILSFMPLYYLCGLHGTSLAFALLSIGFLLAALFLIDRQVRFDWTWKQKALVVFLLLSCEPMSWVLRAGQTGALLSLLITLSWYWLHKARLVASGIALGAAVALKLFPALLLVYFLLRARLGFVAALVTTLVLNLLAAACFGASAFVEYARTARLDAATHAGAFDNCSLYQALNQVGSIVSLPVLGSFGFYVGVCLCLVAIVCFEILRTKSEATGRESDVAFSLFVVGTCLLSPLCWSHYFVVLLVPLAVMFPNPAAGTSRWKVAAYFVVFAGLMIPADLMRLADVYVATHLSGKLGLLLSMVPGMLLFALAGVLAVELSGRMPRQRLA